MLKLYGLPVSNYSSMVNEKSLAANYLQGRSVCRKNVWNIYGL